MRVVELIESLLKMPEQAEVVISCADIEDSDSFKRYYSYGDYWEVVRQSGAEVSLQVDVKSNMYSV